MTGSVSQKILGQARQKLRKAQAFFLVGIAWVPLVAEAHGSFHERQSVLLAQLAKQPDDARLHFRLAELYCEHEEAEKALPELDRTKAIGASTLPVDYLLGMCLQQLGRSREALLALNRFLIVTPTNSPGYLQRARVQTSLGEPEKALEDYRLALRFSTRLEPDLVQETADVLAAQGKKEEAVHVLDSAITDLGPLPSLMLRALELETGIGHFDNALARIDVLEKRAPRPEPWMARRAAVLAQAGRREESQAAWTALLTHLAALPNLERGSHSMSVLAEQARRELTVIGAPATTAESVEPFVPLFPSRSSLGEGSNYEEELDRVDRLIEKSPADASLRFQRAQWLLLDGKWAECQTDCDDVDRLAGGKFATGRLRAELLGAEGKTSAAKKALDEYLGVHGEDGRGYAARARIFLKLKQPAQALADFRLSLQHTANPDSNLFQEVAAAMAENGRGREGLEVLTAGLVRYAGLPSLVSQALELEVTQGDFEAALIRVEAMQRNSPRPERWMARRAELLTQAGRKAEAHEAWTALQKKIATLPNLERGAPALRALNDQATRALAAL